MRHFVAALLLIAGCASKDALIDQRVLDCGPGQDVSVGILLDVPRIGLEGPDDRMTMRVEVSNLSNEDIEVKAIRVESADPARSSGYTIDTSYGDFKKVIPPGESEVFDLPVTGRLDRTYDPNRKGAASTLTVVTNVYLANNDTYRCKIEVPAPRT